MPKYLKMFSIILLVAAVGMAARTFLFPPPEPMQYLTAQVSRKDIQETVLATGTLQAFKQVSVGAQVSGQVKSLKVALGDTVHEGDLIAVIDSQPQQNVLRTAEAALEYVKAQRSAKVATLAQASSEYKRQKGMLGVNATSRQDYEAAATTLAETKADIAALDAQIIQAEVEVDSARVDLGYTDITAPMDGVVVAVITKEGQTVNAAQSTPTIVKLAQLDTMTVEAEISEADVVHVTPGKRVYFTILGEPDRKYEATLRSVEPAPDSIESDDSDSSGSSDEAIYYNALFDVPNPEHRLRISMTAEVTIVLDEAKGAQTIPETALGSKDDQGLYEVRVLAPNGTIETSHIQTGLSNSVDVQVLEGLDQGDVVILGEADVDAILEQEQSRRHGPPMGM